MSLYLKVLFEARLEEAGDWGHGLEGCSSLLNLASDLFLLLRQEILLLCHAALTWGQSTTD